MLYLFVGLVGASMGSFIGALTWRLHIGKDFVRDRSICEHCEHTLAWYDLIPIISWAMLGGRCRYCKKPIGWHALGLEVGMAVAFLVSLYAWPFGVVEADAVQQILFGLWLAIVVLLGALFVYDFRWMLLPNKLILPMLVLVLAFRSVEVVDGVAFGEVARLALLGSAVGGGLFYMLFQISGGRWIGGGDVKLGFVMGALLGPLNSLAGLAVAFYSSAFLIIPLMLIGKVSRKSKIPFGPFLIIGFFVAFLWGQELRDFYLSLAGLE